MYILFVGDQLLEGALLDNGAILAEGNDVVRQGKVPDGMGAENSCGIPPPNETHRRENTKEDLFLGIGVETTQDVIENVEVRVEIQGPGHGDALLLSSAQGDSVAADIGVVSLREKSKVWLKHGRSNDFVITLLIER